MASDVTWPAAVAAGILSFLSPCVLPLVPPYLTFIAGTTIEELAEGGETRARRDTLFAALLFVAGFATVFVTLGATASVFGQIVRAHIEFLSLVAGLAIIAMGLHFLGLFRLAFLYREKRFSVEKPIGLWGAYLMGLAFAFGGTEDTVARGAALLAVYSAGLGIPFIIAALAMAPFLHFMQRFRAHFGKVERVVGVLLVVTGVAFITGGVQRASYWLLDA